MVHFLKALLLLPVAIVVVLLLLPLLDRVLPGRMSPPRRRLGAVSARCTVGPQRVGVAGACWMVVTASAPHAGPRRPPPCP